MKWWLVGLTIVAIPVVFAGIKALRVLNNLGGGNVMEGWQGISNPEKQFPNQDKITILVVGKDYNRDSKGMPYTKSARADTIMLMGVDLKKKTLSAVSVPRDTRVTAPDGMTGKINGTMTRGGIDLLTETVEKMFDLNIDYSVVLKADAVKEIVDGLGGVTVEPIDAMHYDDNWGQLHIHLEAGEQRIDGTQAVGFVRFREVNRTKMDERGRIVPIRGVKGSKEEGDQRRTERQQQLIRAMISEAFQPRNLLRTDDLIDIGFNQVETNLKRIQLVALATIFKGAGLSTMKNATLEGEHQRIGGMDYFLPDMDHSQAVVDWMIKGDVLAANRVIRVKVFNASSVNGAARALVEKLKEQGFKAESGGNAPKPQETSIVYFAKAGYLDRAEMIQKMAGAPEIKKMLQGEKPLGLIPSNCDVMVVIGKDEAENLVQKKTTSNHTQLLADKLAQD